MRSSSNLLADDELVSSIEFMYATRFSPGSLCRAARFDKRHD